MERVVCLLLCLEPCLIIHTGSMLEASEYGFQVLAFIQTAVALTNLLALKLEAQTLACITYPMGYMVVKDMFGPMHCTCVWTQGDHHTRAAFHGFPLQLFTTTQCKQERTPTPHFVSALPTWNELMIMLQTSDLPISQETAEMHCMAPGHATHGPMHLMTRYSQDSLCDLMECHPS